MEPSSLSAAALPPFPSLGWLGAVTAGGIVAYLLLSQKGLLMPTPNRIAILVTDDHKFKTVIAVPRTILRIHERWMARTGNDTAKAPKPLPHTLHALSASHDDLESSIQSALVKFAIECLRLPEDDAMDLDLADAKVTIARLEGELKTSREALDAHRQTIDRMAEDDRLATAYLCTNRSVLDEVRNRIIYAYRQLNSKKLRTATGGVREILQLALDRIDQDSK